MEKDISNLSKEEVLKVYENMKTFVVLSGIGKSMSEKAIKESDDVIKEVHKQPLKFNVDTINNIVITAIEFTVYKNKKGRILMIETENFKVSA